MKMTVFQEVGIDSKLLKPNLMILVSFSSAEYASSNNVKKYDIFISQGTENLLFPFFGTPSIIS